MNMDNCSNHKRDLFGQTDMKVVAEAIGDLHYESLVHLFNNLTIKFSNDGKQDTRGGKTDLGEQLMILAGHMEDSFGTAWKIYGICKPFMENQNPNHDPHPKG